MCNVRGVANGEGPEFGRSVIPIQTEEGQIMPLTLLPAAPDSKSYLLTPLNVISLTG